MVTCGHLWSYVVTCGHLWSSVVICLCEGAVRSVYGHGVLLAESTLTVFAKPHSGELLPHLTWSVLTGHKGMLRSFFCRSIFPTEYNVVMFLLYRWSKYDFAKNLVKTIIYLLVAQTKKMPLTLASFREI